MTIDKALNTAGRCSQAGINAITWLERLARVHEQAGESYQASLIRRDIEMIRLAEKNYQACLKESAVS